MSKVLILGVTALVCSVATASAADLVAPVDGEAAPAPVAPPQVYAAPPVYAAPQIYAAPVYTAPQVYVVPAPVYTAPVVTAPVVTAPPVVSHPFMPTHPAIGDMVGVATGMGGTNNHTTTPEPKSDVGVVSDGDSAPSPQPLMVAGQAPV